MASISSRVNVVIGGSVSSSFGSAFSRAQEDIGRVGAALDKTKRALAQVDGYKKQVAAIGEHSAALTRARADLEAYTANMVANGQAVRRNDPEQRRLANAVSSAGRALDRARDSAARYKDALAGSNISTLNLSTGQRMLEQSLDRQTRAYDRMSRAAGFAATARQNVFDARADLGSAVVTVAPAAFAIQRVVTDSAVFGRENQLISNTEDLGPGAAMKLKEATLASSQRFGMKPQDVQGALGFTIASGVGVSKAVASLDSVTKASIATGAALEDVAAANVTLIQNLKMKPTEVTAGFDAMAKAGKLGNVEFREMAQLMPSLASGAQAIGSTGKSAVAQLGAALQIARRGAPTGSEAATNLENYIQKLMSPETIKKFDKRGVDIIAEVAKWRKNGDDVIGESIKLVSRLTDGGDQGKLAGIFQDQQVQKFIRPMIQNYGDYVKIRDEAMKASGVIDADFAKLEKTTFRTFQRAQSDVYIGFIRIGDAIAPTVGAMAAGFGKAAAAIGDFAKEHPRIIAVGTAILAGAAALTVFNVVGRLAVWGAVAPMAALSSRLILATTQMGLLGGATGTLGRHAAVVSARGLTLGAVMRGAGGLAMRFLIGPVMAGATVLATTLGLPVAAVLAIGAAVVGLGVLVIRHFGAIRGFVTATFDAVFGAGSSAKIGRFFNGIFGFARPAFEWVEKRAKEIGRLLGKEIVTEEDGRKAGDTFGKSFRAGIAPHIRVVGDAFGEQIATKKQLEDFKLWCGEVASALGSALGSAFTGAVEGFKAKFAGISWLFSSAGKPGAAMSPSATPAAGGPRKPGQPVTQSPVTAVEVTRALAGGAFAFAKGGIFRGPQEVIRQLTAATKGDITQRRGDTAVAQAVRQSANARAPVQHVRVETTVNGVQNAKDVPNEINRAFQRGTLVTPVRPAPLFDGAM